MAILDFTDPKVQALFCTAYRTIDLSTTTPNSSLRIYGDHGETIGEVIIDNDHPLAIRCRAANDIRCHITKLLMERGRAFEEAGGIISGLFAAFKLKLAEKRLQPTLDQAWDDIDACREEFRYLFVD